MVCPHATPLALPAPMTGGWSTCDGPWVKERGRANLDLAGGVGRDGAMGGEVPAYDGGGQVHHGDEDLVEVCAKSDGQGAECGAQQPVLFRCSRGQLGRPLLRYEVAAGV